jgi:uncharacterized membrane protein YjgN (DUF898 family)
MDSPDIPPAPPDPLPERRFERVEFLGDGAEYFRIWIVNLALSIVTFGVYSAWAKVRRMQYFYRNTTLAGSSFDYHGEPIAILKGRFIGLMLFGSYTVSGFISPVMAIAVALVIACVMPWMICRSLRFRMHNSSYRGIRFRFSGTTETAYWTFLALPILTALSFFTVGPFWHQRIKRYQHANTSYGGVPFGYTAPVADFYQIYIAAVGLSILAVLALIAGFIVAGTVAGVMMGIAGATRGDDIGGVAVRAIFGILAALCFAVFYLMTVLTLQAFVRTRVQNLVWNHTQLGAHRFVSEARARSLLWILLTNLLGTLGTLGLFWPFGQVRLAKYLSGTFVMETVGSLDSFVSTAGPNVAAVGEEVAEWFDFDIAF